MRRTRGWTLISLLMGLTVMGVVLIATIQIITQLYDEQAFSVNMPSVQSDAAEIANAIAARIRRAASWDDGSGSMVLTNAAASDIEIHASTSGHWIRYYTDNSNNFYIQTDSSGPTLLYSGVTLTLSYYQPTNTGSYTATGFSALGTFPTNYSNLDAVGITVQVTRSGLSGTYVTTVRPRNSPVKTSNM